MAYSHFSHLFETRNSTDYVQFGKSNLKNVYMKFACLHLQLTIQYVEPEDPNTLLPLWGKERFLAAILNALPWSIAVFFTLSHKSYSGAFWVILSGWSLAYLLSLSVRLGSKLDQDWFPPRARTLLCCSEGELLPCPSSVIRRRVLRYGSEETVNFAVLKGIQTFFVHASWHCLKRMVW